MISRWIPGDISGATTSDEFAGIFGRTPGWILLEESRESQEETLGKIFRQQIPEGIPIDFFPGNSVEIQIEIFEKNLEEILKEPLEWFWEEF